MSDLRYFVNPNCEEEEEDDENRDKELRVRGARGESLRRIVETIVKQEPAERADTDGGLYVGAAGIAYAFFHLSRSASSNDSAAVSEAKEYTSLAHRYMKGCLRELEKRGNRVDPSFLLGDGGIVALAAVLASKAGDDKRSDALARRYVGMAELCMPQEFLDSGSDEFFVGRAGYLYGSLWMNKEFGRFVPVPVDLMHRLARVIVRSGKEYAKKSGSRRHRCPLVYAYHGTEYLGAAHGLASILQILIQVPDFLSTCKETDLLVRQSVDYLLGLETSSGNYPCAMHELEGEELVHWCHGAPGVVYLMAAAYRRWSDLRYLNACQRAANLIWRSGLVKKGPGICHGIAGNGYVFLLLHRLTSDRRYLRRAEKFADFLNNDDFKRYARTPDSPYSLYEGIAGTACFLADLAQPDKAAFPFQDVF